MSVFSVSCSDSKFKNNSSASKPVYYEEEEEEEEKEEETSKEEAFLEEDSQYSMGLNSEPWNEPSTITSSVPSTVVKTPVSVPNVSIDDYMLTQKSVKLDVDYLPQRPELPTGCEITSLTTVLNYYGYNVTKTEMADNYLPKSNTSKNFWSVFVGNPRYSSGFGCYAQPITEAANKYLEEQGSNLVAYNCSGSTFEQLLLEIESGRPVVIWGTLNMAKPYYAYEWIVEDGSTVRWITPEHCLVLIGYDLERSVAIISDPMRGIVEYDLKTVKSRYIALESQCVVIY
ncbi:MAG: C39 family peptidase [Clostridia bacterium]|nr:C39 family peptidase [Clostridia bacterium]